MSNTQAPLPSVTTLQTRSSLFDRLTAEILANNGFDTEEQLVVSLNAAARSNFIPPNMRDTLENWCDICHRRLYDYLRGSHSTRTPAQLSFRCPGRGTHEINHPSVPLEDTRLVPTFALMVLLYTNYNRIAFLQERIPANLLRYARRRMRKLCSEVTFIRDRLADGRIQPARPLYGRLPMDHSAWVSTWRERVTQSDDDTE